MSQLGSFTDNAPGTVDIVTVTGNSGGAVPPDGAGNLNTVGAGSIEIVGVVGTNTLTTQLTGLTNHSLLLGAGTSTLTNLGVATNGQLPIGSTGLDPVLSALTAGTNIAITNGAGSITIDANSSAQTAKYTAISNADTPYTALSTDYYIGADVTAGVISILLPDAPTTGRIFVVKDVVGLAGTSNISVTTVGGVVTIDGSATYTMNLNYQSIQLIFNAVSYEVF